MMPAQIAPTFLSIASKSNVIRRRIKRVAFVVTVNVKFAVRFNSNESKFISRFIVFESVCWTEMGNSHLDNVSLFDCALIVSAEWVSFGSDANGPFAAILTFPLDWLDGNCMSAN